VWDEAGILRAENVSKKESKIEARGNVEDKLAERERLRWGQVGRISWGKSYREFEGFAPRKRREELVSSVIHARDPKLNAKTHRN